MSGEHPMVGFTRMVVGDCVGGEGDGGTEFANAWDPELAGDFVTTWIERGFMAGSFIEIEDLVDAVDSVLRCGSSVAMPSIVIAPRPGKPAS